MLRHLGCLAFALTCWLSSAMLAHGYVDLAPTLGRIVREAESIAVVEVERFDIDKGVLILKKVRNLKGDVGSDLIKHQVLRAKETSVERTILDWVEPGRKCVLFVSGKSALVCVGHGWYQVHSSEGGWWRLGAPRADLPLAYHGTVSRLVDAVALMVANKTAVITALPHGSELEGASFDLALNRASLPGSVKVVRIRANLAMPPMAMGVSASPTYLVGMGQAGEEQIPALRQKLQDADPTVRAECAADLGSLGKKAASAAADLEKLLVDTSPRVQMAGAAALLRVNPRHAKALEALAKGLASEDGKVRRLAARAAGRAGPAAGSLAPQLGALLSDPDPLIRRTALQAIATLGPAAAAALDAVVPLLANAETAIDAADALGRLGKAARPALKTVAPMLKSEASTERWAAVRAMAQIGGDDAAPAVQFIIRELDKASEYDTYNMLIYLSLLGPVAKEAIPAVKNARLKNPVLRQTTVWAIDPGTALPWLGPMGEAGIAAWIIESYVQELGDQLKPVAISVAKKIMNGTAGNVPGWGYRLLARFPEETLPILTPGLGDSDLVKRERATVALGYMGSTAAPARAQVSRALEKTQDAREQLLLRWCMREMD
jgi:HEAT repeat protein